MAKSKSAQSYVFGGLELLLDALIPFVRERLPHMQGKKQKKLEQQIDAMLRDLDRRSDRRLAELLKIMKRLLRDGFETVLGQDELSLVNELIEVCNKHVRNEAFSDNDADRALDSMRRLAKAAGASAAAEQLGAWRNEILRTEFADLPPGEDSRPRSQPAQPPPKPDSHPQTPEPPEPPLSPRSQPAQPPPEPSSYLLLSRRIGAPASQPVQPPPSSAKGGKASGGASPKKMYMVRSGSGSEIRFGKFLERGVIAIGWPQLEDLSRYESRGAIKEALLREFPRLSQRAAAVWIDNLFGFSRELPKSDYVITYNPNERLYAVGKIAGEYKYDPGFFAFRENNFPNLISVDWNPIRFQRRELSGSAQRALGLRPTVFQVNDEAAVEEILGLVRDGWK